MKNKILLSILSFSFIVSGIGVAFAQTDNSPIDPEIFFKSSIDYLSDISDRMDEALKTELEFVDIQGDIDSDTKDKISQSISDLSTNKNSLGEAYKNVDLENFEDVFSVALVDFSKLNTQIESQMALNKEDITESVSDAYLDIYEAIILQTKTLVEELELESETLSDSLKDLSSHIEEAETIIKSLRSEFDEGEWVRLEERLKDIDEELGNLSF